MKIKAGKTNIPVDSRIKITYIDDEDDRDLVELTGRITHVFNGFVNPDYENDYVCGVYLDQKDTYFGDKTNLMINDKFEVINEK